MTVVLGLFHHHEGTVFDGAQQGFCQRIGKIHILMLAEIALHGVHHDIRSSCRSLVKRQGKGADRVHDGKLTATQITVTSTFEHALILGDDTTVAHLTAGSGDRQHCSDGQTGSGNTLAIPEIPYITLVRNTIANGLGRVDHTATTDS